MTNVLMIWNWWKRESGAVNTNYSDFCFSAYFTYSFAFSSFNCRLILRVSIDSIILHCSLNKAFPAVFTFISNLDILLNAEWYEMCYKINWVCWKVLSVWRQSRWNCGWKSKPLHEDLTTWFSCFARSLVKVAARALLCFWA